MHCGSPYVSPNKRFALLTVKQFFGAFADSQGATITVVLSVLPHVSARFPLDGFA
jgi:hypothetical protein